MKVVVEEKMEVVEVVKDLEEEMEVKEQRDTKTVVAKEMEVGKVKNVEEVVGEEEYKMQLGEVLKEDNEIRRRST